MRRTVLAFGSFDFLHPGHLLYLERAKKLGDRLIVIVARDESIKMFKKKRPFFSQNERAKMVGALKMVDRAVVGNRLKKPSDRYLILKRYRPSVVVFGYDQRVDARDVRSYLKKNRIDARVVRIADRFNPKRYKSSKIGREIG